MDRVHLRNGYVPSPADWEARQDGPETAVRALAKALLEGRIVDGLELDLSASTVSAGQAYDAEEGREIRAAAALPVNLAGVARPAAGTVRWVSVWASYARTPGADRVTDSVDGQQYPVRETDGAKIGITAGVAAASESAAVRPTLTDAQVLIADLLQDSATPWVRTDTSRRQEARPIPTNLVTLDLLPGAPDNFSLSVADHLDVTLAWWWPEYSGGSQVTTFQVELISGGVTTILAERLRALTYTHRAAASDDPVCYRVRARNYGGLSTVFSDGGVTTGSTNPQAPRSLSLSQNDRSTSLVQISWTEPSAGAPDSYRIEVSTDSGASWRQIASSVLSPQTYTAGAETGLRVRVWAVTGGADDASATAMISLLPLLEPPRALRVNDMVTGAGFDGTNWNVTIGVTTAYGLSPPQGAHLEQRILYNGRDTGWRRGGVTIYNASPFSVTFQAQARWASPAARTSDATALRSATAVAS